MAERLMMKTLTRNGISTNGRHSCCNHKELHIKQQEFGLKSEKNQEPARKRRKGVNESKFKRRT